MGYYESLGRHMWGREGEYKSKPTKKHRQIPELSTEDLEWLDWKLPKYTIDKSTVTSDNYGTGAIPTYNFLATNNKTGKTHRFYYDSSTVYRRLLREKKDGKWVILYMTD